MDIDSDEIPVFSPDRRAANDTAIEDSGLFGTRRRWTNINRFEIFFLAIGVLAALATDGLTIFRLTKIPDTSDADFVYGILIIVNSLFLLLFLITGIFQQRITDIVAFFISAVMLTIYVIAHFVLRQQESDGETDTEATVRLIRLISTCAFNVCFIPLTIIVIRDYERDEFSIRIFGAFPAQRWPLKIYNIFDCIARINTMISISSLLLNLYNWNDFEADDQIFLGIGIPLTFLWLGVGIGMIRLEHRIFAVVFIILSVFQPIFIIYSLYSAIEDSSTKTTFLPTTIFTSTFPSSTTTISTTSSAETTSLTTMTTTTATPHVFSVPTALFVCIGINILTHISSVVLSFICMRNFGRGLKGKIFNNRFDKWFQRHWPNS